MVANISRALFGEDRQAPSTSRESLLTDDQQAVLRRLNNFVDSQIGRGEEKYTGQLTADQSPLQRILFEGSEQFAENIVDPNFSRDVFQRTVADPALRNFNESVIPNITQQFSNAGALSSSGINRALARAGQDLTQNLATQESAFVQNQKQQQLSDLLGLSQLGGQQRGIEQERIGNDYNEFIRTLATRNPALNLANVALGTRAFENVINPGHGGSSGLFGQFFSGAAQAAGQEVGGGLGLSSGGGGGGGGGASNAAGGMATYASFFSDIRLKENITPLYKFENGLNVYSYKYKGTDLDAIGFMAHEVEKLIPDAVGEKHGFKTVNYEMVFENEKEYRSSKKWQ